MLPTKFQVNWPFWFMRRGKKKKKNQDGGHLGFLDRNDLAFLSTSHCDASFQSIGHSVKEKKQKIDFQDGRRGGRLGLRIKTILAIFTLHVTQCFLPKFKSIGLFVQEKKRKIFSGRND